MKNYVLILITEDKTILNNIYDYIKSLSLNGLIKLQGEGISILSFVYDLDKKYIKGVLDGYKVEYILTILEDKEDFYFFDELNMKNFYDKDFVEKYNKLYQRNFDKKILNKSFNKLNGFMKYNDDINEIKNLSKEDITSKIDFFLDKMATSRLTDTETKLLDKLVNMNENGN